MPTLCAGSVEITATVCLFLIVEDFAQGFKPHDLADIADPLALVGLLLVLFGLAFRTWASGTLQSATQLTTIGPYSLVRHPLYVGSFTMLIGFAIVIDDPENIWFVFGPFLFLYMIRVQRDDAACLSNSVWNGRSTPARRRRFSLDGCRRQRLEAGLEPMIDNREYRFVGPTLLGLVALKLWHML